VGLCGVIYSVPPTAVGIGLDKMWHPPAWIPGAKLNYAENLLVPGLRTKPDEIAVSVLREGGSRSQQVTFRQLEEKVARWATALKKLGVKTGGCVGGR
jgi:acetoacetyl-CoA synthetase